MDISSIKAQSNDWIRQQAANLGINLSSADVTNLKSMTYEQIAQAVAQLSTQQQQNVASFVADTTQTQATQASSTAQTTASAQAQAIGRNQYTASRLAASLQCCPERWSEINTDAGLGLSNADMTKYWGMTTTQLTNVLMNTDLETFSNLAQATYGTDFGTSGSSLPTVTSGTTPAGSQSRSAFPLYGQAGQGQNALRIYANAPEGFNPSYGRVVTADEYLAGLAKWGSNPHFDSTAIAGGKGTLPDIPSGVGTTIADSTTTTSTQTTTNSSAILAAYIPESPAVGSRVSQSA